MRRWLALTVAAAALAIVGAAHASPSSVAMGDNFFWSSTSGTRVVSVKLGDSVTWENHGEQFHDVTFDAQPWRSSTVAPGGAWSHTFLAAGTFTYTCSLHEAEGMTGTVVVTGALPTPVYSSFIPYAPRR